jgi:hypothetical protein
VLDACVCIAGAAVSKRDLEAIQAAVTQVSHKVDTMQAAVSHDVDQKLDKRMKMSVTSCGDVGRRVQDFSTIASPEEVLRVDALHDLPQSDELVERLRVTQRQWADARSEEQLQVRPHI